jgi:cell division protein FtsL
VKPVKAYKTRSHVATPKIVGAPQKPVSRTLLVAKKQRPRRFKQKSSNRSAWMLLLAPFAAALLLSLLLIGQRVAVERLARDLAALEFEKSQLEEYNNRLLARVEQLAGYNRISRIAHDHLGLIDLAPRLVVVSQE